MCRCESSARAPIVGTSDMRPQILIPALLALLVVAAIAVSLASRRRPQSGLHDGRLRPCPSSPNCVSSQVESSSQLVEPFEFYGDPHEAFDRIVGLVSGMPRTTLLFLADGYAHFEVQTRLMRFCDDLELQLDAEQGKVHVRSASRVGHSDLGANRARVEDLRAQFQAD